MAQYPGFLQASLDFSDSAVRATDSGEVDPKIPLCNSADMVDGGDAVPFDVVYAGQTCRAFAQGNLGVNLARVGSSHSRI